MKYIVSGGATLSFADGNKFELSPGIHDGSAFSSEVKKHWAFEAYARPLDAADLEKEKSNEDLTASLVLLADENNTLKAQLVEYEKTITDQGNEITTLKAQLETAVAAAADKTADNTGGDVKNAKKQQASN
ncbi:hypothetical protein KAM576c_15260 [Enterobacter asburiae]|uniref:STY1053 family phage-associated protein n=1 Tax=Enterobacter asburiae TaxID=61645 RepID=UPI002207D1C7|nr:hypothetical protein [Enterobacter asburiae]BDS24907.1 hypothetical protein KAM576c_15260 [Enterobacter asburiae]